ncbi:MAG TPA: flavodoxin FldA, partial [Erwinia persicina]|nr:flavodoxin FldA [Erwinia persicina]
DRQPGLANERVEQWVKQISDELQLQDIIEA